MEIVGIDLAARLSAGVSLNDEGDIYVYRTWPGSDDPVTPVDEFAAFCSTADTVFIEDMPPGVRFDRTTKRALLVIGALAHKIRERMGYEGVWLIAPNEWKKFHGLPLRGKAKIHKQAALEKAQELGFVPESPPEEIHSKQRVDWWKQCWDQADAFLIAKCGQAMWAGELEPSKALVLYDDWS